MISIMACVWWFLIWPYPVPAICVSAKWLGCNGPLQESVPLFECAFLLEKRVMMMNDEDTGISLSRQHIMAKKHGNNLNMPDI